MFLKKPFAVFVASTVVLASCSVSAGSVRGVERILKKEENKTKNDNKQNDNKPNNQQQQNNNNNTNNVAAQITVAPATTAPVPPATPSGTKLWISECTNTANRLQGCMGGRGSFEGCTTCLYSQSLLSSNSGNGVISCGNMMCNGCKDQAMDFYACGTKGSSSNEPETSVIPPVADPATPTTPQEVTTTTTTTTVAPPAPIVPVASIESQTTSQGCPQSLPSNGQDCTGMIPAPYIFHHCYYPNHSCSCRNDSPYYMCNELDYTIIVAEQEPPPPPTQPAPVVVEPVPTAPSGVLPVIVSVPAPDEEEDDNTSSPSVGVAIPSDIDFSTNSTTSTTVGTTMDEPAPPATMDEPAPLATTDEPAPPAATQPDDMDIITTIALPTTCTNRMPTSGLTGCDFPPDELCCYAVQQAYAHICTCGEDKKFSCVDGIPSDCPNDQNPNFIATILPSF